MYGADYKLRNPSSNTSQRLPGGFSPTPNLCFAYLAGILVLRTSSLRIRVRTADQAVSLLPGSACMKNKNMTAKAECECVFVYLIPSIFSSRFLSGRGCEGLYPQDPGELVLIRAAGTRLNGSKSDTREGSKIRSWQTKTNHKGMLMPGQARILGAHQKERFITQRLGSSLQL